MDRLSIHRWLHSRGYCTTPTRSAPSRFGPSQHVTVVWEACLEGRLDVLQELFYRNQRLQTSTTGSPRAVVTETIDHNYEVIDHNLRTCFEGISPLLISCAKGHLEMTKWLCASGASADLRRCSALTCITPLHAAASNDHLEMVQWLVNTPARSDLQSTDARGQTPAFVTAMAGSYRILSFLIDFKYLSLKDLRCQNSRGETPLGLLALKGDFEMAHWLFENGCENQVSTPNVQGRSPLTLAFYAGKVDAVVWLLLHGAASVEGHVNAEVLERAMFFFGDNLGHEGFEAVRSMRSKLRVALSEIIDRNINFTVTILQATRLCTTNQPKRARQLRSTPPKCLLHLLSSDIMWSISEFADIPTGRKLRIAKETVASIAFLEGKETLKLAKKEPELKRLR